MSDEIPKTAPAAAFKRQAAVLPIRIVQGRFLPELLDGYKYSRSDLINVDMKPYSLRIYIAAIDGADVAPVDDFIFFGRDDNVVWTKLLREVRKAEIPMDVKNIRLTLPPIPPTFKFGE